MKMATADTYFSVNLEGEEEVAEDTENGSHAWSEMKSLLRTSFTPTNASKKNSTQSTHRNDIDFTAHISSEENTQDVDIYNTLGLNLEKKFRFSSMFKPADDLDDVSAMINGAEVKQKVGGDISQHSELDFLVGNSLVSDSIRGEISTDSAAVYGEDEEDDDRSTNGLVRSSSNDSYSVSSSGERRSSRNRGIWTGGESLSTNKLAMMLSDMQGRLNDGASDNESVSSHSSRSRAKRTSSNSANTRPSSMEGLAVGIDLVEMHSLEPTSPYYNDNRPYYDQGGGQQTVEPNIEVKSIRRGGRITKGDMAEVSSVTSSLSASSAGSRYRTSQSQHRLGSGGSGLNGDSSMLTAANIARNNASTHTATPLKGPAYSSAPSGAKPRSMTPNTLQMANKQQQARVTLASNGRSVTPSGTSSRTPFTRPAPAAKAPAPLVGSALRRSLEASAPSRPVPVSTPNRGSVPVRSITPTANVKSSTAAPVGRAPPPPSSAPRTTTPTNTRSAGGTSTPTTNRLATSTSRSTTPNARTVVPVGRSTPASSTSTSTSRTTTPTAVSRPTVSPVPTRSTTPVAAVRSATPTAVSRVSATGTPAVRAQYETKPTPSSVRKPVAAPPAVTPGPKSKNTTTTTPVVSTPANRRAAAASAAAASTPSSAIKTPSKPLPTPTKGPVVSTPAPRSSMSTTPVSSVRTSSTTPLAASARKPAPSVSSSPAPAGRTPLGKTPTTVTPVSVRNSTAKVVSTPSPMNAKLNTPIAPRPAPVVATRSGGTPAQLRKTASGDITANSKDSSMVGLPLAADIASEPMEPSLSYNYHSLQNGALTSPKTAVVVNAVNTAIYMPSMRHSSQTIISAMFLTINAAANSSQKNLLANIISNGATPVAPVAVVAAEEAVADAVMEPTPDDASLSDLDSPRVASPPQVTLQLTRKSGSNRNLLINTGADGSNGQVRPSILKTTTSFISPGGKKSPSSASSSQSGPKGVTIAADPVVLDIGSRPMMNGRTYQSLHEVNNITAALKELSKSTSLSSANAVPAAPQSTPPQSVPRNHNKLSVTTAGIASEVEDSQDGDETVAAAEALDLGADCSMVEEEGEGEDSDAEEEEH